DVLGAVAEIHDVPHVFDVDLVAEGGGEPVADQLEPAAERRGRRAVTAHADGNGSVHGIYPPSLCRIDASAGAIASLARPHRRSPAPKGSTPHESNVVARPEPSVRAGGTARSGAGA